MIFHAVQAWRSGSLRAPGLPVLPTAPSTARKKPTLSESHSTETALSVSPRAAPSQWPGPSAVARMEVIEENSTSLKYTMNSVSLSEFLTHEMALSWPVTSEVT